MTAVLQQNSTPIVFAPTRADAARSAGLAPLVDSIRNEPAQDPLVHAEAFCAGRPDLAPQAALQGARALLLASMQEDQALITVLRDWLWTHAWLKSASTAAVDGPDPLAIDGRLQAVPKARLDPLMRAIAGGAARAELYAGGDAENEYREAALLIARHAGLAGAADEPGAWIDALCRSVWRNRLAMRVKAIVMLDLAKAARPSDCRFSSTCNQCSSTCPRLWTNDTGYKQPEAAG